MASDDDTCNITTIISKSYGEIKSVNHPEPYPKNCEWTYVIQVGNEHRIQLKVLDWDVDTENGDELSIQPSNEQFIFVKTDQIFTTTRRYISNLSKWASYQTDPSSAQEKIFLCNFQENCILMDIL